MTCMTPSYSPIVFAVPAKGSAGSYSLSVTLCGNGILRPLRKLWPHRSNHITSKMLYFISWRNIAMRSWRRAMTLSKRSLKLTLALTDNVCVSCIGKPQKLPHKVSRLPHNGSYSNTFARWLPPNRCHLPSLHPVLRLVGQRLREHFGHPCHRHQPHHLTADHARP